MVQREIPPRKVTRDELNSLIDRAADLIRTAVDYKFILVLLFLKRLNDLGKSERLQVKERLMKETGLSEKDADDEADKFDYTFKIPKQFLWDEITKDVKNLPERLATAISETAKLNKELQGVINRVDFLEFARNQENRELLRQLVELFNKYELNGELSPNILGDAYEHILMKFAPQKAKEGEIYTPREVIKLMVEILDPKPGESVYDPCCGSGGMLIISYVHVVEKYGKEETGKLFLYGQERSPEIYAVGQMDLLLHGIQNANLACGDTLDYPRFRENGRLKQFDIVIANPPWNQSGYGEERLKKADFRERFSFDYTPAYKGADWVWIQHMLASAKENGKVGVVIDNGCLFKGGKHKAVRSKIVDKDWVECVILLPEKLFYNTGAPGAIIILNKNKQHGRKKKTLFINASAEFIRHPSVRRLNSLSKDTMKKITEAYNKFQEIAGFSRVVEMGEIIDNKFDLNVTLYAEAIEKKEETNIPTAYSELKRLEKERLDIAIKLEGYLSRTTKTIDEKSLPSNVADLREMILGITSDNWDIRKVADLFKIETGTTPSTKRKEYWENGSINWITPTDLSNLNGKTRIRNSERKITEKAVKENSLALMPKGSLVLSTRAPVGYVAVLEEEATFNQGCKGLIPRYPERISSEFYCYYLLSKRQKLQNLSSGSTFKELSKEKLSELNAPFPPLKEQNKIVDILSTLDEAIQKDYEIIGKNEKLKKGLLDLLLTIKPRKKAD